MNNIRILLICIIVSLHSCTKEPEAPILHPPRANQIRLGDYSNMLVDYDDIRIQANNYPESVGFDINDDNRNDFEIISFNNDLIVYGYEPRALIKCLHDSIGLHGYYNDDTIYRHIERYYGPIDGIGSGVNEFYLTSCQRISDSDSILDIRKLQYKISPLNWGDSLSIGESYQTVDVLLKGGGYLIREPEIWNLSPDTILRRTYAFYNDCYQFPEASPRYVGFKYVSINKVKLGWLQLKVTENYKVVVLETAIQE